MDLAPIIVFCYNRPWHVEQTLKALSKNVHASESILYIFCDGLKDDATEIQLRKVTEARNVVKKNAKVPEFKEVHIIEREENYGLGESIITGVTEIINKYGKVIVLEDDLETSPLFLDYINQCLDHYEARKSVFSISGLSRPHPERFYPQDYPYDVYVSLTHHPTGWATWEDRWNQVDWDANCYQEIKNNVAMINAFKRLGGDYFGALKHQQETGQNVWSIRFALAHFVNHAVSICPIVSYINHIGWDLEATNAIGGGGNWKFERLADKEDVKFCDVLYEDARIINAWRSFSTPTNRNIWGKFINWIGRKFLNRDEYYLKSRVYAE